MSMKGNLSLDGKSILIMGGQPETVRATACLLAANGAFVFISGDDEPTLAGHLNYIRQKVPGCSVIGTAAIVSSTAGISDFFLHAEMALPMHHALIYFPVFNANGSPYGDVLEVGKRLFCGMANHRGGQCINICEEAVSAADLKSLCQMMRGSLDPLGIKVTSVVMPAGRLAEMPSSAGEQCDEQYTRATAIAGVIRHVLCQPRHCEITEVKIRAAFGHADLSFAKDINQ